MNMTTDSLIRSFRSSLKAGKSRREAHEIVTNKIDSVIDQLIGNDCEVGDFFSLLQWWCKLDYRTI